MTSTLFAADRIRVEPEMAYPIIQTNSAYSWQSVRNECLPPTEKEPAKKCNVQKIAELGKVDDKNFYYVLYEWLDQEEVQFLEKSAPLKYPRTNTAIVLFYSTKESPNMLHAFYADRTDLNEGWFEEPRLIRRPAEVLLQIPHRGPREANAEVDTILRWKDSVWRTVDTQSWMDDIQEKLPEGCSVILQTLVNFDQMKASNYLWRPKDEDCCPTCGRFTATLAIEDDKLVIKGLQHNLKARLK